MKMIFGSAVRPYSEENFTRKPHTEELMQYTLYVHKKIGVDTAWKSPWSWLYIH